VHSSSLVGIRHLDFQGLALGGEIRQMRGIPFDYLKGPGAIEDMPVGHRSSGDPKGNGLAALLEKKAIVAWGKVVCNEEAVLERERLKCI